METKLIRFPYKYMEYEKNLLLKELETNFPNSNISYKKNEYILDNVTESDITKLSKLEYIDKFIIGNKTYQTIQSRLEYGEVLDDENISRQKTRYSTHGIHEYKGKYNPQIVRGIIGAYGISDNSFILDPFCGSGTTLVECAHYGNRALGVDINPFAVFITNTKLESLHLKTSTCIVKLQEIMEYINHSQIKLDCKSDKRLEYLAKWIPQETLQIIETIRIYAENLDKTSKNFILALTSNLIRDYSNQEPSDLRIRKRRTPFPETPFLEAWYKLGCKYIASIKAMQDNISIEKTENRAYIHDIKRPIDFIKENTFDAMITSPPYATALPYIDTQRISLVWLGFCTPEHIMALESSLIGSREFVSKEKASWKNIVDTNEHILPDEIYDLVKMLDNRLTDKDGFRRQAVPTLLYRYFSDMKNMFTNTFMLGKNKCKFGLVVGNNKTTLGGIKEVIDTPYYLSIVAKQCGWNVDELYPLQTYKRYGLNQKNAINSETLIMLTKN